MATTKSLFCGIALVAATILFLRSCTNSANSLSQWGFPVNNSSIVIDESLWNLKGEEKLVKANLTLAQAKALRKAFAARPTSQFSYAPITPKDIHPMPGNPQWKPQLVKKYWGGSFDFDKENTEHPFFCFYVFDVGNPNNVVLYFYAVTFDD